MSCQEPPNKRRRLSNDSAESIHTEIHFNSNNNLAATCAFPETDKTYPINTEECEVHVNNFLHQWKSFITNHVTDTLPIQTNFPDSIQSSIDMTPDTIENHNNNSTETSQTSQTSASITIETEYKSDINNNNNSNDNELMQEIMKLRSENQTLTKVNNDLREQLNIQKKQTREYNTLYSKEIRTKESYQLRLKGLAQMIKTGNAPHFERVSMNKMNTRMSQSVSNIKNKIKQYIHTHAKNKNQINVSIDNMKNHPWIPKKSLLQIIKNHIIHNNGHNKNPSKPDVLIRKQRQRRQSNRNINNSKYATNALRESSLEVMSANINDYNSIAYNFILNVYRIKKDSHRIQALCTGYQRGLKSMLDIPCGTVIGQYIGIEYTDDEYQSIFNLSNEEAIRNVYAFDCVLNEPMITNTNTNTNNKTNIKYKAIKMIIDGYGLREMIMAHNQNQNKNNGHTQSEYSAHLLYINDCRQDISMDRPTTEDIKYWNVDFVSAEVNGIPMVFLVTRCNIEKDTELATFYGRNYDVALKQQTEYERMRNSIVTLVDNSILKGIDLTNDVWTID